MEEIKRVYVDLCAKLEDDMEAKNISGKSLILKLKTADFELITRSKSLDYYFHSSKVMIRVLWKY